MVKRTSKPISTISYNTQLFFVNQLDELLRSEKIAFYAFVRHQGEEGQKDHIHLFVEPMGCIDVLTLQKQFIEPCADGKPLAVMPFVTSDWQNWYLYSRHDSDYLLAKHETKEVYDYPDTDFVTSNRDEFIQRVSEIDKSKYLSAFGHVLGCIKQGMTMGDALIYLNIPMQQIAHFPTVWNIACCFLKRGAVDVETDQDLDESVNIMHASHFSLH